MGIATMSLNQMLLLYLYFFIFKVLKGCKANNESLNLPILKLIFLCCNYSLNTQIL